ncbi:ATP-binding protein [Tissierella sp. Yu-01]|uniref:ATP-binding protein n=1 Tax=Tissierella sp. Yu-01 TaxID=3035694 RepID=UPI00240D4EF6|nr:ATP-binding protein [Tissierella sp. Yu-01]WFA08366.1 ATP-binding protein [Tissierella sp. Yu-01]
MYEDIMREVSLEYEKKRDRQENERRKRIEYVYKKIPAIRRIDEDIMKSSISMARYIIGNPQGYKEAVEKAKETIESLKMEKAYLLTESNIPPNYMDLEYDCGHCNDTGYLGSGEKCNCLKQELVNRAYRMSNLGSVLNKENFHTFNIEVFNNNKFPGEDLTPRENMIDIVGFAEGFISNFDETNGENLLFYGTTGLGKTFLCNCIAKALLDKNKIVVYQTAFTILDILERRKFGKDSNQVSDYQYNLLFNADLLIIDDLGTEVSNTFTNAEIFNIVNTRIISGKKTLISTNLTPKEISEIYTDRVFSRILDKFIPLKFYGKDLRWE